MVRKKVDRHIRWVEDKLPKSGKVSILFFTDRQFAESIFFQHCERKPNPDIPEQMVLL